MQTLKILLAHNYYKQPGGEDVVVANEYTSLIEAGHRVELYAERNDEISTTLSQIRAFTEAPFSKRSYARFSQVLHRFQPDIVHIHNHFPIISPSAFIACKDLNIPVVQTLHNYRLICASGLFMRNGQICEDCLGTHPYRAVLHKCYRSSAAGSLAVARMIRRQQRDDWRESVTRFIALSNFAREKFISGGLKPERVIVKPNGLEDPKVYSHERNQERYGALFVGRLSYEKGVKTLVEGWKSIKYPLRIVGEGPLLDELRRNAPESILFLGKLEREQIFYEMSRSAFMVMPSLSYEGFPMTLVESLACGLPIISSKIGSLTELIQHGVTGLHIHPGSSDDLARKALEIIDNLELRQQMSYAARAKYLENYTSRKSLERLVEIYQSAIAR